MSAKIKAKIKERTEDWATRDNHGPLSRILLNVMAFLYGTGVKARLKLYKLGILKPRVLPCMVISIGNITAGGTGKTPMTMHIARRFVTEGSRVVILSRGYKGTHKGIGLVSDGAEVLMTPEEAGDEPWLMAEKLKAPGMEGVPIIVGADRYEAGLFAIEKFSPDVILLDDGFQHIALARDKNIVLIDARTDLLNERLLPRGTLREPIRALNRARIIMIKDKEAKVIDPFLKALDKPVVAFSYKASGLKALNSNEEMGLGELKDKKVFIFSGLASPASFEETVLGTGAKVVGTRSFPDHYSFTRSDIDEIQGLANGADIIVTTEKDATRLKGFKEGLTNIYSLEIEVVIDKQENFFRKIR